MTVLWVGASLQVASTCNLVLVETLSPDDLSSTSLPFVIGNFGHLIMCEKYIDQSNVIVFIRAY